MTARLRVDLDALTHNYALCHAALQDLPFRVATAAVVKADAYGLGACEISSALQAAGCSDFFVANALEGQALRAQLGSDNAVRIFVFEGALQSSVATLLSAQLTPVINSISQWQLWSQVRTQNPSARQQELVLHVDTGMQRLGFEPEQLARSPLVDVTPDMLVTHLACADEPGHPSVAAQLQRIVSVAERYPGATLSLANSAGTLGPHALDELLQPIGQSVNSDSAEPALLARPGIALYGGEVFAEPEQGGSNAEQIWPVACFEGQVLQLRDIAAGTPVGYGASFVAQRDMRIATIGLGYADGLPRLLSNTGQAYISGHLVPIVGRVSMDLTCLDVSEVTIAEGDWVEFFGANLSLGDVARQAQTIDYEVLCGVGPRVPRHYERGSL